MSGTYDSNGPDVKIKGTASQVTDRYQALARDALVTGNRVAAENYLQHAEHYQRIMNAHAAATAEANAQNKPTNGTDASPQPNDAAPQPPQEAKQGGRGRGRGRSQQRGANPPSDGTGEQPQVSDAAAGKDTEAAPEAGNTKDREDAADSTSSASA
jgi:hypothetical protein